MKRDSEIQRFVWLFWSFNFRNNEHSVQITHLSCSACPFSARRSGPVSGRPPSWDRRSLSSVCRVLVASYWWSPIGRPARWSAVLFVVCIVFLPPTVLLLPSCPINETKSVAISNFSIEFHFYLFCNSISQFQVLPFHLVLQSSDFGFSCVLFVLSLFGNVQTSLHLVASVVFSVPQNSQRVLEFADVVLQGFFFSKIKGMLVISSYFGKRCVYLWRLSNCFL